MNYNEWNNYTAIDYLKYALKDYNKIAGNADNDLRVLREEEIRQIIGSMRYAFDMKTLEEAYEMA